VAVPEPLCGGLFKKTSLAAAVYQPSLGGLITVQYTRPMWRTAASNVVTVVLPGNLLNQKLQFLASGISAERFAS